MQLRACIAMCVFVVIATLPLHFVKIEAGKFMKLPPEDKGGAKYAMYYQISQKNKTLSFRFQNRFRARA